MTSSLWPNGEFDLPRIPAGWFLRPDGIDASHSIHGIGHALRVYLHADAIAANLELPPWQREAVRLAAMWHDIGRTDEEVDYYHGAKSAGKVVGMGLHNGLDPMVLETALYAVTHHSGSEPLGEQGSVRTPDPIATLAVFRVLKDADALDRVRLGDLDDRYLRLAPSRARVDVAYELLRQIR
ncbi:MAG: hypothetical protein CVT60_02735 [Actinobacteria bacterium HGW-Actinobacteria-10]|nr:MAG: hypothetical protein CVT60_02735 [Actinobacteria bacterium HGW-Actinobacteria-10]